MPAEPRQPIFERDLFGRLWLPVLTFFELGFFDRRLFSDPSEYGFVLHGVSGVLSGHPVSKSWQHRFLGPWLVSGIAAWVSTPFVALQIFSALMTWFANVLLFRLLRLRGANVPSALFGVACFGLAHVLSCYRLEYPWDGIDVLLFMGFGFWAARGGELVKLWPLLAIGALNHETILYLPFWYLLAPLDAERAEQRRPRALLQALAACLGLVAFIWLVREHFYRGPPPVEPGQTIETQTPLLSNHLHVAHNLRMLFVEDFRSGKAHIAGTLLALLALLLTLLARGKHVRAVIWTLCVFVSIVYFGYVNETRHYLLLLAFWFAYAWPAERGLGPEPARGLRPSP